MKEQKMIQSKAGPGIQEALKRQDDRVNNLKLSDDFDDQVMKRVSMCEDIGLEEKEIHVEREPMNKKMEWRSVAAVFVGFLLVGGMAFAALHVYESRQDTTSVPVVNHQGSVDKQVYVESDSIVNFENQKLEALLSVVAEYYAHALVFKNDSLRELRITTTWNRQNPLKTFVEQLNELDGLFLSERDDTIFVEQTDRYE